MVDVVVLQNFFLALGLGGLIGLEREYALYHQRGHKFAGIRTFPLITLFGALSGLMADLISPWVLLVSMVMVGVLIIIAYYASQNHNRKHIGATSEMAGFLAFFIGILAYYGEYTLSISLTVIITLVLYARSLLHHFAEKITRKEMLDTLIFILIAFVILPILPNQWYGPLGIFNPYILWLMVVLISGISFVGYVLLKWFGEKGIALAGLFGGLIGSTATTINFAERSKHEKLLYEALSLAAILSSGVMFIRILIEVFAINRNLFLILIIPMTVLSLITSVFSYLLWRKIKKTKGRIQLGSPLRLKPAVQFGLFFALVMALVKISEYYFSANGIYIISIISGFAGVDAITVSLAQLAKTKITSELAAKGIILGSLSNIAIKGGIVFYLGGKKFRNIVLSLFGILIGLGLMMIFLI